MFGRQKHHNKHVKFVNKHIFTGDVVFLLSETLKLIEVLLTGAIIQAHGKGVRTQRRVNKELSKDPSDHARHFKNLYYLLYFIEMAPVLGPVGRRFKLTNQHVKYATGLVEQSPKLMEKLQSDLGSFINYYYHNILAAQASANPGFVEQTLSRLSRAYNALGYSLDIEDRNLLKVRENKSERARLYEIWFRQQRKVININKLKLSKQKTSEYAPYLRKTRKNKSVQKMADYVCNFYPFGNPTKIKILISCSVIILEQISKKLQKSIDDESRQDVRQKSFFNADMKKLSSQVEKRSGEYHQQLGKDINSFVVAVRRLEEANPAEGDALKAETERWTHIKKAVQVLGFSYTLSPDNKIMKLTVEL